MKHPSSYLKMRVLGAIDGAPGRTSHERILHVAGLTFVDEEGNPRQFTWRTIQTWLYRYRNHGITGMEPKARKDKGKPRKVTPEEVLEAINAALPHFHGRRFNKTMLYRFCIERGLLRSEQIARNTFSRFINEYGFLDSEAGEAKKRLAFAMQYANQLWQADTMYGPFVANGAKGKCRTYLIVFLDDASRVACHGEFFFRDDTDAMLGAFRSALYKRGVPEQIYVDNGSNYSAKELTLTCARLGCILRHTPVRDGAAKGKVERFFRRVRDQFLLKKLDLSSLGALNRQFNDWVEADYNHSRHGGIHMKPIDRFGLDLKRIRYLPPCETNDELFYAEETRKVKKDNTFSFGGTRYEAPADLRDREVTLRFERSRKSRIVVYYKEQRMGEARPLDLIANGQLRRVRKEAK